MSGGPIDACLVQRIEITDLAVQHLNVPVGTPRELLVVGHHDNGGPVLIDFLEKIEHLPGHQRIKVAGWLIGKEKSRFSRQGTCDRHTLLLAAGKLRRQVRLARGQTDESQHLFNGFPPTTSRPATIAERYFDIVRQAQVGNQIETLKYESNFFIPDPGSLVVVDRADILAIQFIDPAAGLLQ